MQAGLNKGAQRSVKVIKAEVPSRYKTVRKAIRWRALKRKQNRNQPGVKVGAGVGKRQKTTFADRSGRRGVGISTNNIHWWFLGTEKRFRKDGKPTGEMKPQNDPIYQILRKDGGTIRREILKGAVTSFRKELGKLIRFK